MDQTDPRAVPSHLASEDRAVEAQALLDAVIDAAMGVGEATATTEPDGTVSPLDAALDAMNDAVRPLRLALVAAAGVCEDIVQQANDAYLYQRWEIHVPGTAEHTTWQAVRRAARALALLRGEDGDRAEAEFVALGAASRLAV